MILCNYVMRVKALTFGAMVSGTILKQSDHPGSRSVGIYSPGDLWVIIGSAGMMGG